MIYFYSGTGNSLWAARELAKALGEPKHFVSISKSPAPPVADCALVGLVFPVHMWGVPRAILNFIDQQTFNPGTYCFAVATNAGEVSRTLVQLDRALRNKNAFLAAGWGLKLPSNYIPWGGPGTQSEIEKHVAEARQKLGVIAETIAARSSHSIEKKSGPAEWLHRLVYRMASPHLATMDRAFWADSKCNGCGICAKVCPVKNIELQKATPVWQGHCQQCFACLQWCPQQAVQFGKNTVRYKRYHHPEVGLQDFLAG
jgi:ferredoxin